MDEVDLADLRAEIAALGARGHPPEVLRSLERLLDAATPEDGSTRLRDHLVGRVRARLHELETAGGGAGEDTSDSAVARKGVAGLPRRRRGARVLDAGKRPSEALAVAVRRYRERARAVRVAGEVREARLSVPTLAGRYHPSMVTAETLEGLRRVSPGFLAAQLDRFDLIAILQGFGRLYPKEGAGAPKKTKRGSKKRRG